MLLLLLLCCCCCVVAVAVVVVVDDDFASSSIVVVAAAVDDFWMICMSNLSMLKLLFVVGPDALLSACTIPLFKPIWLSRGTLDAHVTWGFVCLNPQFSF